VIDSGLSSDWADRVAASRRFDRERADEPADSDRIGHGGALARVLLERCPAAVLHVAQVFDAERTGAVSQVVRAIDWLIHGEVAMINMSFGLAVPDLRLREACRRAARAGIVLVASAAARGRPSYPAAYPECIAVSGDARCANGELSWIGTGVAEFGAHPFAIAGRADAGGGASFAAARVSGAIARLISEGVPREALREALKSRCSHFGPERRHG
jgi:hypothetical protein